MCNHDVKHLVGTADGLKCKLCGRTFKDFKEVEEDRKKSEPQEAPKTPATVPSEAPQDVLKDEVKETPVQDENPLKKASDAKSDRKPAAKKTTSKKGAK